MYKKGLEKLFTTNGDYVSVKLVGVRGSTATKKDNIAGYCHFQWHHGFLTKTIMKKT